MLRELKELLFHYKPCVKPILRYLSSCIGNMSGVNELKRSIPIVVSLTSSEDNFDDLELTIYSLLNQQVCPDRIILWLSDEYELTDIPYSITRFIKNGLEIRFVEEKGSYTGIIEALNEFDNAINVLAKDTVYYPKDWLKKLYHSYISQPSDIHAHTAFEIRAANNQISSYKKWKRYIDVETAEYTYYPKVSGGILYPPNCFKREVFREDIYKKKVQADWEVWAWCMALVSGRKIRLVKNHIKNLTLINYIKVIAEEYRNLKQYQQTDIKLSKLMEYYQQNVSVRLEK